MIIVSLYFIYNWNLAQQASLHTAANNMNNSNEFCYSSFKLFHFNFYKEKYYAIAGSENNNNYRNSAIMVIECKHSKIHLYATI